MLRNVKIFALSILVLAALLACSSYDSGYYYHTSYNHSYSYPADYGMGCVHSRKTTKTTIKHPVYGKIKVKSVKNTTYC